jgi:hypothetical protein
MTEAVAAVEKLPVEQRQESRSSCAIAVLLAVGIFAVLSITCAVTSEGFLEADSCTHYLYARLTLRDPIEKNLHHLVNVWGRPLCTGLYAIPAQLGHRTGVRIMSCVLALVCGLGAMRVAKLQGYRWPALALICTLAQPLVFLHSFSELTELPFAALMILAFWAYRVRQFWLMALLVGMSPMGRPEGFGFIGLAAAALLLHRKWYWLPLLFVPLALWNYAGWELYGREGAWWQWVRNNWPYAEESLYPAGPIYHFLIRMPVVTSPLLFPAMVIGAGWSLRFTWPLRRFFGDHVERCQASIACIALGILVGHSLLYAMGKMASNGELRYMLAVAPFWGLLSAKGWEWVFARFEWRRPLAWAGVAALLPITANFAYPVVPLVYMDDWKQARQIAAWLEETPLRKQYPTLMLSHPAIFYFMDSGPGTSADGVEWKESTLAAKPAGTLMIWDPIYGVFNSDAARSISLEEIEAAGWLPERLPDDIAGDWRVFVSPQPATQPTR